MLEKHWVDAPAQRESEHGSRPLYVSLERSLLRASLQSEILLALITAAPGELLRLPRCVPGGRAKVRELLVRQAALIEPSGMPYNQDLLAYLRQERRRGRQIVLVTESSLELAERTARALELFDSVICSCEGMPSREGMAPGAHSTLSRILDDTGGQPFDYIGGGEEDLEIWRAAHCAIVTGGSQALVSAARGSAPSSVVIPERESSGIQPWLKALRPHQWVKNLLVFLPLLAAHRYLEPNLVLSAALAFIALSLAPSGTYIINDLLDLRADRQHPTKRLRPFTTGRLTIGQGGLLIPVCLAAAAAISAALPVDFRLTLGLYVVLTLAYSCHLKRVPMVDVLVLSSLFTLRVFAGGAAVAIAPSFWLLAFSVFIFLSLALVKRYIELQNLRDAGRNMAAGRGYHFDDLPLLLRMGIASGFVSLLVVALSVNSPVVPISYRYTVAI